MNSVLSKRATAVIVLVAAASLADKEGYFYKLNASNEAVICASATDTPAGVIGRVSEDGLEISAIPFGNNIGTVGIKLGAAVTDTRKLLQLRADGSAGPDALTGARSLVAVPLETGAADEIIECILLPAPRIIAAGAGVQLLSFPVTLATIAGAGDVVTNFTPGFAFEIVSTAFVVAAPVTTAAKLATLNVEINATDVTGGVIALTSAAATPLGKVIAGTAVTALNTGDADDTISVEASAVTAFAEGSGAVVIALRNLDTVNAG